MHTVFGRVVDGQKYVTEIENQRVDTNHRPYADIRVVRCGELVLIKPSKGKESDPICTVFVCLCLCVILASLRWVSASYYTRDYVPL